MKLKYLALSMAFVMAVALTGCSAGVDDGTASVQPSGASSDSGAQSSAEVSRYPQNNVSGAPDPSVSNDAAQGGGAGGTNSQDSDGLPEGSSGIGDAVDDIGDVAEDAARGAGNAIGNTANNIGNAMS